MILYSSEFTALSNVFYLFVIGQFLNNIGGAFQSAVVGIAKLKMHTLSSIAAHSLWVIIPLLMVNKYGTGALGMGFVAGGIAGPLMNYFYLRNRIDLRFSPKIIQLFGIAALTLIGAVALRNTILHWRLMWTIITTSCIALMIRR